MFLLSETRRFRCASRPASACRSSGCHLGKFVWGSNLVLVFEAVQSRPSTTFPESWHDYWKQYLRTYRSFGRRTCLPDSPNWRYRQNYDVNKCVNPGGISGSNIGITWGHGWMALLAKHTNYQTYSLPPSSVHRRIAGVCFELHFRVTPGQFRSEAASSLHRRLALLATSTRPSFSKNAYLGILFAPMYQKYSLDFVSFVF